MAKKKKTKAPSRRRSRRIGATGSDMLMTVAGIAAGSLASRFLTNSIGTKVSPTIANAGKIVAGAYLLPKVAKGSALVKGIGYGMVADGAQNLLVGMGVIKGIDDMSYLMPISGYDTSIAGLEDGIAGIEQQNDLY